MTGNEGMGVKRCLEGRKKGKHGGGGEELKEEDKLGEGRGKRRTLIDKRERSGMGERTEKLESEGGMGGKRGLESGKKR